MVGKGKWKGRAGRKSERGKQRQERAKKEKKFTLIRGSRSYPGDSIEDKKFDQEGVSPEKKKTEKFKQPFGKKRDVRASKSGFDTTEKK